MALIGLAGCVGTGAGSHETAPAGQAPSSVAAAPRFDDSTGAVTGLVTDTEFQPVGGALLQLKEAKLETLSAADGTFTFSGVPPGTYELLAAKLGYDAHGQKVTVEAGKSTGGVSVLLNPLAIVEARAPVRQFVGYIVCSIGHAFILSEECGEGVGTPVGTFGKNDRNKIDWKFNVEDTTGLLNLYFELDWKAGSAAATQLAQNVANGFACTPGCSAKKTYAGCGAFNNYGPPIVDCLISTADVKAMKPLPWDLTVRAWAAPVPSSSPPVVVLEQAFKMYRTDFFGAPYTEGYSAVRDA